jgi:hypothetical protein
MKKIFFATIALLAALSCSKEEEPKPQVPSSAPEFTVEIDNTRIVDAKSGREFSYAWTEDALVSVFYNTAGNAKYKFTGNAGDVSGNIVAVSAAEGDMLTTAYAIYPYAASTTFDNDTFFFTLPTNQTYTGVGLGVDSNIMVAKQTEDDACDFKFKNASGYISLRLYGTAKIAKIKLTGNNNETLTGNAAYDMYNDEFIVRGEGKGGTITLNCNQEITLGLTEETATPFMFAIPPTTFEKGFTVTVTDTKGRSIEQAFDTAFAVGRNEIHSETMVCDSSTLENPDNGDNIEW